MSLNKVMIIGRLGGEPELKYTQSGSPVCTFSVATDESYTDNSGQKVEKAEWHRIVVFQKAAENCSQYLAKGSLVFIEGKLETRKWQDQQGQDRFVTEIKAQRVQFLDRKADGNGQPGGQQERGRRQQGRRHAPPPSDYEDLGPAFPSEASGMDDVPF